MKQPTRGQGHQRTIYGEGIGEHVVTAVLNRAARGVLQLWDREGAKSKTEVEVWSETNISSLKLQRWEERESIISRTLCTKTIKWARQLKTQAGGEEIYKEGGPDAGKSNADYHLNQLRSRQAKT